LVVVMAVAQPYPIGPQWAPMMPPRRPLAAFAVSGLLVACTTSSPSPSASSSAILSSSSPSGSGATTPIPTATPASTATPAPAQPPIAADPPPLAVEPVASGLDDPIGIVGAPSGWLLVNERNGRVIAVRPGTGVAEVALDITDRVLGGGERGLLGLALDPEWPAVPRALVHYSDLAGDTVLSEFVATEGPDGAPVLDPASERILLQRDQPYANHNGGQLAFDPDGFLWLGLGDGGSGGDPGGNGQNPFTLLGKILRIDPASPGDTSDPDAPPYGIPPDNPFADGSHGAPEVFLYGLRNPWRFSFDHATGQVWIGDVGQGQYEEIDRIDPTTQAGANLGWNVTEGAHCYNAAECATDGLTGPLAEYTHDFGCSVTGGFVYRGQAAPQLSGAYLYADFCSGKVWAIPDVTGGGRDPRVLRDDGPQISSFAEDLSGELYLLSFDGRIYSVR
jgi:glucose/arabinose dehydrogenase